MKVIKKRDVLKTLKAKGYTEVDIDELRKEIRETLRPESGLYMLFYGTVARKPFR